MLDLTLDTLKPHLAALASAWLARGAESFGMWEAGRPLAEWPVHSSASSPHAPTVASIQGGEAAGLELRVTVPDDATALAILKGEAGLIAELVQLDDELDAVTTRLIETQDQLLALYDLTHGARNHPDVQGALAPLARQAARLLRVESAFAIVVAPEGQPLLAQEPITSLSTEQALALFSQVRGEKKELLTSVELDEGARPGTASLFVMPIVIRDEVSAALGLLKKRGESFTSPEMKLARTIADQIGTQMENALLFQETLATARVQTEMELARRVQDRLLPQTVPQVRGLGVAARSRPALELGGDFYDFLSDEARPFTLAVGDVSGKGMSAALVMSMMHTSFRAMSALGRVRTPAESLTLTDEHLYDDLTEIGAFVTMFLGIYDATSQTLMFANAGHSPVVYCPHLGQACLLEADRPPIGILPAMIGEDGGVRLGPGDVLIIATDGFSEARDAAGEMFGYPRLQRLVESLAHFSAPEILDALFAAIEHFSAGHPQDDDQTAVVLKGVQA